MKKKILVLFLGITFSFNSFPQQPQKLNPTEIFELIQKLNFLGSALYIAAHPDDENTNLIAYLSNHVKARTAYLSLTRGDGGQNLIGPELRELLGVIRTQELLAARRIDGGEQMFTRANDFGYSKHPDETLSIWDKQEILNDVVWAIRKFKPDIIINRFNHNSAGKTHGHHTSSALLSLEAFDLVNDKSFFSDQLEFVETWQPKRLFFNTSWWFYGSQENFQKADKSNMIDVNVGGYYPLKGLSNNELASLASSQHLCQGFGRLSQRGSRKEYLEFLKGDFPEDTSNLFSGIDTSWNRIKGGSEIEPILSKIEANFNFIDPSSHINDLMKAYQLISNLNDTHWREVKTKEIKAIIQACAGLYLEVTTNISSASNGSNTQLNFEVINRSNISIELVSYEIPNTQSNVNKNIELSSNTKFNFEESIIINNDSYTTPYWLNKKGTLGMYNVPNQNLVGLATTPNTTIINFNLLINKSPISIAKNAIYKYAKPDKGEIYRPFEIIPQVTMSMSEKVVIFDKDAERNIQVKVKAGKNNIEGNLQLNYPIDWNVYPKIQRFKFTKKGDEQLFDFTVIPPKNQSEGYLSASVNIDGNIYNKELVEINYSHIPFQSVLLPCESKIVKLTIEKKGDLIAYIEGAGDAVPESLQQIGYRVVKIKPIDITSKYLAQFDAVVVGIRAYNILEELNSKQQILFDFVKKGGNMIVQYNTSRGIKVERLAPYNLELSRDRVTDEKAEVRIINPNHEILNLPNKITQEDFKGWTQERGLYFPKKWGQEFAPLLSINDPGEIPKTGSLLVAKYGKGHYIYTGLSFFREFPAGVSGAYRLFANMLSIGKNYQATIKN